MLFLQLSLFMCVVVLAIRGACVLAMSPNKEAIKHGLIFVNFMTACMAGSFLAGGDGGSCLLDRCSGLGVKCVTARS
jgi:hypothetical protein